MDIIERGYQVSLYILRKSYYFFISTLKRF